MRRADKKKFTKRWLIILVLLAGSLFLLSKTGTYLVKADPPLKSDVIVALMGATPEVVLQTADLYNKGIAPGVLMARESQNKWNKVIARGIRPFFGADQFREIAVGLGVPAEHMVILPSKTRSTIDEARVIREYLRAHPETDSLTLVCAAPHSRRAGIIFRKVFRKAGLNIRLVVSPSPYSDYDGRGWWKNREKIQIVIMEWIKLAGFVLVEQWSL